MIFECPMNGCEKELSKLQYQHFNFKHDTTPREAIIELHGDEIRRKYQSGLGVYRLADSFDESYMTKEMVDGVVREFGIRRSHDKALSSEYTHMNSQEIQEKHPQTRNPEASSEAGKVGARIRAKQVRAMSPEEHPRWKGGNKESECSYCGKEINVERHNYQVYNHHYCSDKCQGRHFAEIYTGNNNPNFKHGGYTGKPQGVSYGSNWKSQRKKALERDQKCQLCGKSEDLEVHHKVPVALFSNVTGLKETVGNHLSNLKIVCKDCHHEIHRNMDQTMIVENQITLYSEVLA